MINEFNLTPQQIQLLKCIANDYHLRKDFYFAGGTALAYYYYQHRISDDIDFFSNKQVDGRYINMFLLKNKKKLGFINFNMQGIYDRYIFMLNYHNGYTLKTEFSYFFPNIYPLHTDKRLGIRYIDKKDIIINKLGAMMDRTTEKDYFDFYYLYNDLYSNLNLKNLNFLAKKIKEKRGIQMSVSYFIRICVIGYKLDYSVIKITKVVDDFDIKLFYYELGNNVKKKMQ